jgi:hypothetical protein
MAKKKTKKKVTKKKAEPVEEPVDRRRAIPASMALPKRQAGYGKECDRKANLKANSLK